MARLAIRLTSGPALTAIFAVGYALVAGGMALDRATVTRPELARWVPPPFRQKALAVSVQRMALEGEPGQSLALAQRLVRRDPFAPQAIGLLGTALLGQGNGTAARRAYRASARLGWRDAATQVYWFDTAVQSEDFVRAAMRFEAIARQWPDAPGLEPLSARLEADPRGLAALAQHVAAGAKWAPAYAIPRAYQPPERLAGRAKVLIAAAALGGELGCERIAALVEAVAENHPKLANELWASQCPRAASVGHLTDGGFETVRAAGPLTVFDWQFPGDGTLDATVTGSAGDRRLRLRGRTISLLPVARQRLVLAPGRYEVSWSEQGTGASRMAVSLSCRADRGAADPQEGNGLAPRRSTTLVFPGGCEAPLLQLWLKSGTGEVTIDNVTITPINPQPGPANG